MAPQDKTSEDPADRIPQHLRAAVLADVAPESIQAVAEYNLDDHGQYIEGCLVLDEGGLSCYCLRGGAWEAGRLKTADLSGAAIVEGLGMSVLRLLTDGTVAAEFRFTLRHAKEMARLHRVLERQISGKSDQPEVEDETPTEEKKVRCETCGRVIPSWSEVCPACLSRRKVLSRLLDFAKPYKRRLVTGAILALLTLVASLARPYLTKPMLSRGLGVGREYEADYGTLMVFVGILVALTLFSNIGSAVQQRIMAKLGSRIARDVRDRAYEHLHKLGLAFFSRKPTGSLVTRITSDSDRIWDFVAFTAVELVISILTIVGVGVALFILDWKLACFVLIPIPIMMVLMFVMHRKMHRFFHRIFHRWSKMTSIVSDAIPGVRVIKAFSQEDREVERFADSNRLVYEGEATMINLWTLFGPILRLCSQVGSVIVWGLGGYWAVTGRLDAPTLMAFIAYMWMFYGPIHMLSHMDRSLNRAATSVQRIFEILDTEPTVFSKAKATAPVELAGRIELRNLSFSYDGVRRVLKDINLAIEPGKMIGLAGPSGAGKSTLVNLICRFYDPLSGSVLIDGIDVRDYDVAALRRHVGIVLQEPFLFHGSVAENIAYGNPDATLDQIISAARAANAHEFIVGFPDGYDTLVGERGQTLSGGERQRVSIARAVLNNPRILILDEATSSVDTETEKQIQEALDRLIANRTTLAIAHRLSTLRKADHLVILDKGEIVEQGTHDELAGKEGGLYAKLLRMQTETQSYMAIQG